MIWLSVPLVYFVIIPAFIYWHHEKDHRHAWRRQWWVEVPEHAPGGAFRDQDGEHASHRYLAEQHGAPREVKRVALVSLLLGHMLMPVAFIGVGLLSIPSLILAAMIYRNAFGLLRCEPAAAVAARVLRHFALWLNAAVMLAVNVLSIMNGGHGFWLFFAVYAGISLVHARGLGQAADAIDAVHAGPVVVTTSALPADFAASTRSSRGPEVAVSRARPCLDRPPLPRA